MDIKSIGSQSAQGPASAAQKPAAEERKENVEKASSKEIQRASRADQNTEARESAQQQRVGASPESDQSNRPKKSEARPQVSDSIARAISRQVIDKSEAPATPEKKPKIGGSSNKDPVAPESRAKAAQEVPREKAQEVEQSVSRDGVEKRKDVEF